MEIEVKLADGKKSGCRASVSVTLPEGGFTVNRIHVRDENGKVRVTFPLSPRGHPYITLRGSLKREVYDAIQAAYCDRQKRAEEP